MLKMILADDEPVITKGIQMLVDWEQMGIEIEAVYKDGKSALEHILTKQPDIALLDIQMPEITGVEILKQIHTMGLNTKVIFISGYQDFSYAHNALTYGAKDYLLKPVNRQSLIRAVGECMPKANENFFEEDAQKKSPQKATTSIEEYFSNEGETTYILTSFEILGVSQKEEMEQKLISFSVFSQIEEYVKNNALGIVFHKNSKICFICKKLSHQQLMPHLQSILDSTNNNLGIEIGCVVSDRVDTLMKVLALFDECTPMLNYFYFENILQSKILQTSKEVFQKKISNSDLTKLKSQICTELLQQNKEKLVQQINVYVRYCAILADGKQDVATYSLFSSIKAAQEKLSKLEVNILASEVDGFLEYARNCTTYKALCEKYVCTMSRIFDEATLLMQKTGKKDISKAVEYIQNNYATNITLEVIAKHIHMNAYYFSSYFKKQTGKNFKEYLNLVRMEHAMELLMTTDKKSYEIADMVGFTDYRYFTEIFSRYYGKTPTAYRKNQLDG